MSKNYAMKKYEVPEKCRPPKPKDPPKDPTPNKPPPVFVQVGGLNPKEVFVSFKTSIPIVFMKRKRFLKLTIDGKRHYWVQLLLILTSLMILFWQGLETIQFEDSIENPKTVVTLVRHFLHTNELHCDKQRENTFRQTILFMTHITTQLFLIITMGTAKLD